MEVFLFRGLLLCSKEGGLHFSLGLNAEGLVSRLFLLCLLSELLGSPSFTLPFLNYLRSLSTVSFAHGSGGSSMGGVPAELIISSEDAKGWRSVQEERS